MNGCYGTPPGPIVRVKEMAGILPCDRAILTDPGRAGPLPAQLSAR